MKAMQRPQPPKWAEKFFRWFCNDHLSTAVLGDLIALYERRISKIGKTRADLLFIWNVVQFIQPFALRKKSYDQSNHAAMFTSNFKIAWRSMKRQKMYSAIKVGGFALGLATCIIISIFIRHELSYDKHYHDGDRMYVMVNSWKGDEQSKWTAFPAPVASIIQSDYPEVEKTGRLIPYNWFRAGNNLFRRDDQAENTYEEKFAYADQSTLEILQIPMVYGNARHALDKPNTIVISKSKADKYFPGENPVGRTIYLNDDKTAPLTIGGVMEDFPSTSHLDWNFFITLTGLEFWPGEQTNWCCWNYNVYVKLKPGVDPEALGKKFHKTIESHYVAQLEKEGSQSAAETRKNHSFILRPVKDIHLFSTDVSDFAAQGDVRYIWLFGSIAAFILVLACINFINLSTAKSASRAKEVGLRKVVGSFRSYIVRQFLVESTVFSFVSFLVALVIVVLSLPFFNSLAGKSLVIPWTAWWFIPVLIIAALAIGVIAGIYPAFYLSSFKPVDVLKGSVSRGMKSSTLRGAMVVFQFTTSIVLIIGTFIVYKQMNYILNTKIGYDKEQVVMIQGTNTVGEQLKSFTDELKNIRDVKQVTTSSYYPITGTKRDQNGFYKEGRRKMDVSVGAQNWNVDENYLSTLGIRLVEGRNFDEKIASDSTAIIVNQAFVKALGIKKPLEEKIENWRVYTIIGVVEDFNYESMRGNIQPLVFTFGQGGKITAVKVNTSEMRDVIASIDNVWDRFMPNQPIRYTFMDDGYAKMYEDVSRMGRIFATFSILAIVVACLGLFALSAFMVEQRNKEISIRLVLGASINSIFRLLTQNFVGLVMISFFIAMPLAWYLMSSWLKEYAYKTDITWDIFVASGAMALLIALMTISYQALRAAWTNPANALRSE